MRPAASHLWHSRLRRERRRLRVVDVFPERKRNTPLLAAGDDGANQHEDGGIAYEGSTTGHANGDRCAAAFVVVVNPTAASNGYHNNTK